MTSIPLIRITYNMMKHKNDCINPVSIYYTQKKENHKSF